jgi:LPPG:FO 2-phospho-L-lactate transferase
VCSSDLALARYVPVRPTGSAAAPTWFNLGDRDLATHLYRTARLAEGATLTEVTGEICRAWGVHQRLLPMTDSRVATMVTVHDPGAGPDGLEVPFQEYFVQRRHSVPVSAVRFAGAETARPGPGVLPAIADADVVVVAPSNPLVSIAPLRALAGVDTALAARRESVVAISPIVGGAALKGPADRMLAELGMEPSVVGVARLYAPIASILVIDPVDASLAPAVEAAGMRPVVTESVMSTPARAHHLASVALSSVILS